MHFFVCAFSFLALAAVCARAQGPQDFGDGNRHQELSLGVRHIDKNSTPAGYSLNGGVLTLGQQLSGWLGLASELSSFSATNTAPGTSFSLLTVATGPRFTMRRSRVEMFGQGLIGVARGHESFAPGYPASSASVSSLAWQFGGGVNLRLSQRFSLRLIDVQELRTGFAEADGNSQEHLMFGAGITWRYNMRRPVRVARVEPPMSEIFFSCGTDTPLVAAGEHVNILGHGETVPDAISLRYAWDADGGKLGGEGRQVYVDTTGLRDGRYKVHGRASLASSPVTAKECEVAFRVSGSLPALPPDSAVAMK